MAFAPPRNPADLWLGTGFAFPINPPAFRSGMELVRQSIETILDTEPGERVMRPEFGCGLRRFLMAPNTVATRAAIQGEIEQALRLWEPRIQVTGVEVTPDDDPTLVWIDIAFVRLVDQRSDNLVHPFYLR